MAIIVANSIHSNLLYSHNDLELLVVNVSAQQKFTIACMYLPPSPSEAYEFFVIEAISALPTHNDIILTGDFNCPDINWSSQSASSICLFSSQSAKSVPVFGEKSPNSLNILADVATQGAADNPRVDPEHFHAKGP